MVFASPRVPVYVPKKISFKYQSALFFSSPRSKKQAYFDTAGICLNYKWSFEDNLPGTIYTVYKCTSGMNWAKWLCLTKSARVMADIKLCTILSMAASYCLVEHCEIYHNHMKWNVWEILTFGQVYFVHKSWQYVAILYVKIVIWTKHICWYDGGKHTTMLLMVGSGNYSKTLRLGGVCRNIHNSPRLTTHYIISSARGATLYNALNPYQGHY